MQAFFCHLFFETNLHKPLMVTCQELSSFCLKTISQLLKPEIRFRCETMHAMTNAICKDDAAEMVGYRVLNFTSRTTLKKLKFASSKNTINEIFVFFYFMVHFSNPLTLSSNVVLVSIQLLPAYFFNNSTLFEVSVFCLGG